MFLETCGRVNCTLESTSTKCVHVYTTTVMYLKFVANVYTFSCPFALFVWFTFVLLQNIRVFELFQFLEEYIHNSEYKLAITTF